MSRTEPFTTFPVSWYARPDAAEAARRLGVTASLEAEKLVYTSALARSRAAVRATTRRTRRLRTGFIGFSSMPNDPAIGAVRTRRRRLPDRAVRCRRVAGKTASEPDANLRWPPARAFVNAY